MSGFLREMAHASRSRVTALKGRESLIGLRLRALDAAPSPPLHITARFELIAEYKRRSPALGRLVANGAHPRRRVEAYARGGAVAVSVLTEPTRFDGRLEHLAECAAVLAPLGVPVLRKDFLIDTSQIYEARAVGAGGILLIARLLPGGQLGELLDCARELGLFVLLEAFDSDDADRVAALARRRGPPAAGAPVLIGVNCRDLETLTVAPSRFAELASRLPKNSIRVAESGIESPADCAAAARAGYRMALVGGALMAAPDPEAAVRDMLAAGRAA